MSGWDQKHDIELHDKPKYANSTRMTRWDWFIVLVCVTIIVVSIIMAMWGRINLNDWPEEGNVNAEMIYSLPDEVTSTTIQYTEPIREPATAQVQAERLEQVEVGPPPIPPTTLPPTGIHGLPFAPPELSGCDEMMWYAYQFDLPARFEGVGWRESRCMNDVNTWCCYGYWQLYVSLHLADHRLGPKYEWCGIRGIEDIFGNDPLQKQKNACGARAVYDVQGGGAWDAW